MALTLLARATPALIGAHVSNSSTVGRPAPALADLVPGHLVRDVVLVAMGAVLLAASAQVAVPLPFTPVPITGQTFAVLLIGAGFGLLRGVATMLAYLAVGLAGVPVFSPDPATGQARNAVQMLEAPSAGYVIGMLFATILLGWLSHRTWDRRISGSLPQMLLGNAVIYSVGLPWLMAVTGMSVGQALAKGLFPFLAGDLVKLGLAVGVLPMLWRIAGRNGGETRA
jgi:biotin transport system substrate-specific component